MFWCAVPPGSGRQARPGRSKPSITTVSCPSTGAGRRVQHRPQPRAVRVLAADQLVRAGGEEVGVTEALPDEQRLCVARHATGGQPCPQGLLVIEARLSDAMVPGRDVLAGAGEQQVGRPLPYLAPRLE